MTTRWSVTITFLRGTTETHEWLTDVFTREDQLHLFKKDAADNEHVGSYPLIHIKKWQRTRQ